MTKETKALFQAMRDNPPTDSAAQRTVLARAMALFQKLKPVMVSFRPGRIAAAKEETEYFRRWRRFSQELLPVIGKIVDQGQRHTGTWSVTTDQNGRFKVPDVAVPGKDGVVAAVYVIRLGASQVLASAGRVIPQKKQMAGGYGISGDRWRHVQGPGLNVFKDWYQMDVGAFDNLELYWPTPEVLRLWYISISNRSFWAGLYRQYLPPDEVKSATTEQFDYPRKLEPQMNLMEIMLQDIDDANFARRLDFDQYGVEKSR